MIAISLWQPYATAIAVGAKRIETRHWPTNYRGPLLIHAAKRKVQHELIHLHSCWNWQGALRRAGWGWGAGHDDDIHQLPFGALVASCTLSDCRPTESFTQAELDTPRAPDGEGTVEHYQWTERQMGNFDLGRYGWVLTDIVRFLEPIPYKGSQGFFHVPREVIGSAAVEPEDVSRN